MGKTISTVRQLYFFVITISFLSTTSIFYAALRYCCNEKQTIPGLPYAFVQTPMAVAHDYEFLGQQKNKTRIREESPELDTGLRECRKRRKVLVIDLQAAKNESWVKPEFKFTTESLPNTYDHVRQWLNPTKDAGHPKTSPKKYNGYYFVFSFTRDQLSAATRRLFRLNALAKNNNRLVVEPLVLASSFFGDQLSRKKAALKTLYLYYDMSKFNNLLENFGYARFATRKQFLSSCRSKTGSVYVR